jgi:DNA invertase Pin-like site-specific DNA recombinase
LLRFTLGFPQRNKRKRPFNTDQLRQMRDWCQRHTHTIAVEYVEAGASATDDRPARVSAHDHRSLRHAQKRRSDRGPFTVTIFRDMVNFAIYERRLNKAGVKIISITQPTGEEFGEMMRRFISLFDRISEQGKTASTRCGQ